MLLANMTILHLWKFDTASTVCIQSTDVLLKLSIFLVWYHMYIF